MADMAHLIEPVIPSLPRYARTFVRGAADADDLVQDTLERAAGISGDLRFNLIVPSATSEHLTGSARSSSRSSLRSCPGGGS